ncbi:hypothetical protein P5673_026352 [Acropora cervicornis]|uniref:Uncharacterized protein n=1 Tax=Acropora cervicornis TaxID=6130 RepID=A0AAD9UWP9_ACRCE|nr:hypothetical protein P5673_026352 [Acropora cervicornis]
MFLSLCCRVRCVQECFVIFWPYVAVSVHSFVDDLMKNTDYKRNFFRMCLSRIGPTKTTQLSSLCLLYFA